MGMVRAAWRREDGQSSLEWLGVAAVVVALVLALVLVAPDMGGSISDAFSCMVARLGGAASCGADASFAPGEPEQACTVASTEGRVGVGGRIVVVDLSTGDAFIREERSDGTIDVTFIDEGSIGASAKIGGGAAGDINGAGGGARAEAEIGAAVDGFIGKTVRFDDPAEADQFIQDRIIDEAINTLPPGIEQAAGLGRWIVDQVTGHDRPQGEDVSSQGGVSIGIEGRAEGDVGPLRGELGGAASAGAQVKLLPDGSAEVTIGIDREVSGQLGLIASLGGEASASGRVTVTLGPDGTPTAIAISGTVAGEIQAGVDVVDLLDGVDLPINYNPGRESTVSIVLDLTDPALRDSAGALIDRIGDGLRGGGSLDEVIGAAGDLIVAGEQATTATMVVNDLDTSSIEGSISGSLGIGLGAEVTGELIERRLISASYWDPVQDRFVPWIRCTG